MLVLSRKQGERISIGSGIELVVLRIAGNRVRIGVSAPAEVPVHRHEVAQHFERGPIHEIPMASEAPEIPQATFAATGVTKLDTGSMHQA